MTPRKQFDLDLKVARPINKTDIPDKEKGGTIKSLDEYQDLQKILAAIKEQGIGAYEAFDILNLDSIKKRGVKIGKSLLFGFSAEVRKAIGKYGVEKQVHVEQRRNRLFLVAND